MDSAVIVINYNAGNIRSVLYALERLGRKALVTDDAEQIQAASKVIFPGVGEASSAMKYLMERGLDKLLMDLTCPVLGICLGMQLMCSHSEENDTPCFGIFNEPVRRFTAELRSPPKSARAKIPQIGWNRIYDLSNPLFEGVANGSYCYFVHGYYAALGSHSVATTDYLTHYSSALQKDNFFGVQFHPEKSAAVGEQVLKNFLAL